MLGSGGLQAGRAFVDIEPRVDGDVGAAIEKQSSGLTGTMGKLGGLAGKALIGGVGAAVAVGVKGVFDFAGFEQQMNEVFTLMPGVSGPAMGAMTDQVKGFSKEFGVLPNEVVPALYSSLSAGVPPDNVFAFLETAQKAAKGGVTELETAVDGISSVVNAYGDDVIGATEASDLMFTAVRLGKTTFDELSGSLSNVTPIASGLGVQFSDITAGLATMTAQGTPTAVATTQLRSLFVELSKAGGETATTFESLAGKTFQEFIAEGGNTADALALLQEHAEDSGVQIQDLFGSVEAGSAALSLSGSDSFVSNIEEMGASAGATEKAFEQMDTGLAATFDKIKARAAVFSISVGEFLAPMLEKALEASEKLGAFLAEKLGPVFAEIGDVAAELGEIAGQVFGILFAGDFRGGPLAEDSPIVDTLFDLREGLEKLFAIGKQVFGILFEGDFTGGPFEEDSPFVDGLFRVREILETVFAFVKENAEPILAGLAAAFLLVTAPVTTVVAALFLAYQRFEGFRNVVDTVVSFLLTQVVPRVIEFAGYVAEQFGNLVEWVREHWASIQEAIERVVNFVAAVIEIGVETALFLWRHFGETVVRVAEAAWENVRAVIEFAVDLVRGIIELGLALITGEWGAAWDAVVGILGSAWELVKTLLGNALGVISTLVVNGLGAMVDLAGTALEKLVGFFRDLPGRLKAAGSNVFGWLSDAFRSALNWIIRAWNGLEFRIPGFDPPGPGPKFGGFTLGVPDIPELADGGDVLRRGLALVGEDGPELLDLDAGARVTPLDTAAMIADAAGARAGAGPLIGTIDVDATGTDVTADEIVDRIFAKAGWHLTTRNDGRR